MQFCYLNKNEKECRKKVTFTLCFCVKRSTPGYFTSLPSHPSFSWTLNNAFAGRDESPLKAPVRARRLVVALKLTLPVTLQSRFYVTASFIHHVSQAAVDNLKMALLSHITLQLSLSISLDSFLLCRKFLLRLCILYLPASASNICQPHCTQQTLVLCVHIHCFGLVPGEQGGGQRSRGFHIICRQNKLWDSEWVIFCILFAAILWHTLVLVRRS